MKSKTVIAFAVASAFAWPIAAGAHGSARARTPVSVDETSGAQMQDRFPNEAYMDSGTWHIATPLSDNETDNTSELRGIANQNAESSHRGVVARDEVTSAETFSTSADELAAEQQSSEDLALADQGTSTDYYLVPVPSDTEYIVTESQPDYYIVELLASESE